VPLADDDAIRFDVIDTGIGIALEDQERIFEEFTQIENPLQKRFKGTGLGLSLCRRLATLLGGRVMLESRLVWARPSRGHSAALSTCEQQCFPTAGGSARKALRRAPSPRS
jgi:signal transduction histidine kinase